MSRSALATCPFILDTTGLVIQHSDGSNMGEACFNTETKIGEMPHGENPSQAWYAVQTGYRCEQRVASCLTMKGFRTYLPLLREIHQWTDRRKLVEVPAFSYVVMSDRQILIQAIRALADLLPITDPTCPIACFGGTVEAT